MTPEQTKRLEELQQLYRPGKIYAISPNNQGDNYMSAINNCIWLIALVEEQDEKLQIAVEALHRAKAVIQDEYCSHFEGHGQFNHCYADSIYAALEAIDMKEGETE